MPRRLSAVTKCGALFAFAYPWIMSRYISLIMHCKRFREAHSFDQPLHTWNTSRVTSMSGMFRYASEFEGNLGLAKWNTNNVVDFSYMFQDASSLDGFRIGNWNVSKARTLQSMFDGATIFNQPLQNWNVQQVTNLQHMFRVSGIVHLSGGGH